MQPHYKALFILGHILCSSRFCHFKLGRFDRPEAGKIMKANFFDIRTRGVKYFTFTKAVVANVNNSMYAKTS